MHIRIILKFFEKYKCLGIAFFLQSSRYISNEQSRLKTTGLYDDLLLLSSLFHFFYFIFSAPISFSLCFPISLSLFFFLMFFIKHLSSIVEKLLCVYIYMYIYGEGNGNLLQYSCLVNPMDRGSWWATVHRVTKSHTWLKWLGTGTYV